MLLTVPWDAGSLHRECPNRYDLGFNVSATEPLAPTIYGIRDVHLVKLVYDLGHSDSTGSIGSDFIEGLDLSFDLVNCGAGQIPLFYH